MKKKKTSSYGIANRVGPTTDDCGYDQIWTRERSWVSGRAERATWCGSRETDAIPDQVRVPGDRRLRGDQGERDGGIGGRDRARTVTAIWRERA